MVWLPCPCWSCTALSTWHNPGDPGSQGLRLVISGRGRSVYHETLQGFHATSFFACVGGDSLGSKLEALAADKHAPVFGTVPCPEDADKKVPIIAMSEAPCKQICKNVCTTDLTKSCSTVPVVSKVGSCYSPAV